MIHMPTGHTPQFSGHETFPLRQLWLRKAYDLIALADESPAPRSLFTDEEAIVRLGVGKNMVNAIRFWATACDVIRDTKGGYEAGEIGAALFHPKHGLDPYSENVATAWLVHWFLASNPGKTTTWWYLFNHVVHQTFERESIVESLEGLIAEHNLRISLATLRRDVECCIRSYVPRLGGDNPEEVSEPVLGELGLIQQNAKGVFEFRRGAKRTLPDGVFAFALLDYWRRIEHTGSVMAFDRIAHDFNSPGRVFKLDEDAVAERLIALEELSEGQLRWIEQAGIRQIMRTEEVMQDQSKTMKRLLRTAYVRR